MVNLERLLIVYDTRVFVQKWPETRPIFHLRLYHQHQLQLGFTAFAYTTKYSSRKEKRIAFCQKNGGGRRVKKHLFQ